MFGGNLVATVTKIDAISKRQKCEDLWDLEIGTKSVDVMVDGAIA